MPSDTSHSSYFFRPEGLMGDGDSPADALLSPRVVQARTNQMAGSVRPPAGAAAGAAQGGVSSRKPNNIAGYVPRGESSGRKTDRSTFDQ